jgi:hypothetical protein
LLGCLSGEETEERAGNPQRFPEHAAKYDWFARVYETANLDRLIPRDVIERLFKLQIRERHAHRARERRRIHPLDL